MTTPRVISTVRQFAERNPAFPVAGIRWWIFNEEANGLKASGAILRIGRKVLIDENRFFAWLDKQSGVKVVA